MKASELIELLKKKIDDYGDWEVIGAIKKETMYDEETEELWENEEIVGFTEIKVATANRGEQKVFILR